MQIFTADVVVDADENAPYKCMTGFRSINVNVAACIFKRSMTHCFVSASPTLLEPTISRIFIGHQTGTIINIFPERFVFVMPALR